ncbi:hypothetical protein Nepgr_033575 [Nepenthes gracilis]|uniref:Uncharacterized protein n=1 Tax=Nepenthes gracilis TaxID=150966 RepID=A0AAD3TM83_NEPGR|nr:hypothetical protein Nepgr_033575 [Nepenthes gracilis]
MRMESKLGLGIEPSAGIPYVLAVGVLMCSIVGLESNFFIASFLTMQMCMPFVSAFGSLFCFSCVDLCGELVAIGLCLEKDYFWMCSFSWMWNQLLSCWCCILMRALLAVGFGVLQ